MPSDLPRWRRAAELVGRRAECGVLDRLLASVRAAESRALVVHGEPGAGKTALLGYAAVQALGFRVLRAGGVQSEMEFDYAGVHQLCLPLLDRLDHLPAAERTALRTAFGLCEGPAPDRILVGLAVLGLLAEGAQEKPLLCVVDDYPWLDSASAQVLAFVARRLGSESLGLIVATREVTPELEGLPQLAVDGLKPADAAALLDTVLPSPVDPLVKDQLIAETHGNPLALLELPRGLTAAELAGGFGLPGAGALPGTIEGRFVRRAAALPEDAQLLLLLAASDASGDTALVRRAAESLGIGAGAEAAAVDAGLLEGGARLRFPHPLARSAIYRSAPLAQRQQAHLVLAGVTDPRADPDRRAWHRAQAASGPDDDVADELERSAGRARARGGLGAAAAFLLRAASLTLDPARRADRALAGAEAQLEAGSFEAALDLLAMAEAEPLGEAQRAQAGRLRAQLTFVTTRGNDAAPLLLRAAEQLAPVDVRLSRLTYLEALSAAIFAGRLAGAGGAVSDVARAVADAPPAPGSPTALDLLLDGTAAVAAEGYAAGRPVLQRALAGFGERTTVREDLHWLWLASVTAMRLCEDERWDQLSGRHVELAREAGALSELPLALTLRALCVLFRGEAAEAAALTAEARAVAEATGVNLAPYGQLGLAAFGGTDDAAEEVFGPAVDDASRRGEGVAVTMAEWARAVRYNGLGRYTEAVEAARRSIASEEDGSCLVLPFVELIEAAVRSGQDQVALEARDRLAEITAVAGTDWASGLQARADGLVDDDAEAAFRSSITSLGRTELRLEAARVHLLYGEWLRRRRRTRDAREQLTLAHDLLERAGAAVFAERAARELRLVGRSVRAPAQPAGTGLTPQEAQIARMARDGLSNPEIASRLFLSRHTVQHHLRGVYAKLGIASRAELARALPDVR